MTQNRLLLGDVCRYKGDDGDPDRTVTIVGTWDWPPKGQTIAQMLVRVRRFGQDPRTDDSAKGYLLLPSDGGSFIHAPLDEYHRGELTPLF